MYQWVIVSGSVGITIIGAALIFLLKDYGYVQKKKMQQKRSRNKKGNSQKKITLLYLFPNALFMLTGVAWLFFSVYLYLVIQSQLGA